MRTRSRAWTTRTAVVAIITAVATFGVATPAQAASPQVTSLAMHPGSIRAGDTSEARFVLISNPGVGTGAQFADYQVEIQGGGGKVICESGCAGGQVPLNQEQSAVITTAEGAFFGQNETVSIRVTTSNCTCGSGSHTATVPLTIQATATIPEVSGRVTNIMTGEPIKTAKIEMQDSVGTRWTDVASDDDGNFVITKALYGKDIAAGFIVLSVTKDGYQPLTRQFEANVPKTGIRLTMEQLASSVTPTTDAPSATESVTASSESTTNNAPPPADDGLSTFSLMLIIIGGLLVLLGIGAIVLLFVRRNNDDDYGPPKPGKGGPGGPGGPGGRGGPPPPGRGGPPAPGQRRPGGPPDRTAPMRPGYGPPRPGAPNRDQTTIARSPLADNPTQHGRPRPTSPGRPPYSGPPSSPQPGYGPPPSYPPQGGYGPPPGGYSQQPYGAAPPGPPGPPPHPGGDPRQGRPPGEGRRVDWMDDY